LRQAIQLLRLLLEPLQRLAPKPGRVDLANRVQAALKLVKRGLIDAEWQIRKAAQLEAERLRERERGIPHEAPEDTAPPASDLGEAPPPPTDRGAPEPEDVLAPLGEEGERLEAVDFDEEDDDDGSDDGDDESE